MALWAIWLVVGIILIVAEMATLTFYLLWLGLASFAAGIVAMIAPDAIVLQVFAGIVIAAVLTVYTKPLTRRLRSSKGYTDVIYQLVGQEGVVIENIPSNGLGVVRVGNETWSANAEEPLDIGTRIIVVQSHNTTLQVQKWKELKA
jgi:membrane protein implicated in regulation of membrane protease activity